MDAFNQCHPILTSVQQSNKIYTFWNFTYLLHLQTQVETPSVNGSIKIPIAVLKIGEHRVIQSNLEFPEGPVTFKLIEGDGPIIISGLLAPPDTSADGAVGIADGEDDLGDEEEVIQNGK